MLDLRSFKSFPDPWSFDWTKAETENEASRDLKNCKSKISARDTSATHGTYNIINKKLNSLIVKLVYQVFCSVIHDYIIKCPSEHELQATNTTSVNSWFMLTWWKSISAPRAVCSLLHWLEQSTVNPLMWHNVYQRNRAVCILIYRDQLHHEMHVSFSARNHNIHPDTHGLRRRSHHVVHPIRGLHTEGQRGVGALGRRGECHFWEKKVK